MVCGTVCSTGGSGSIPTQENCLCDKENCLFCVWMLFICLMFNVGMFVSCQVLIIKA